MKKYDYIMIGYGLATTSLLMNMSQSSFFDNKTVLVIESSSQRQNKTWSFWKHPTPEWYDHLIAHQRKTLQFSYKKDSLKRNFGAYPYCSISSQDRYEYINTYQKNFLFDLTIVYEEVIKVEPTGQVQTATESYEASYVFDSRVQETLKLTDKNLTLYQVFHGDFVRFDEPVFDSSCAKLMEFYESSEVGFMYVLPHSPHEALVEYTTFSPQSTYKNHKKEVTDYCSRLGSYHVTASEKSVIPMTDFSFPRSKGRIWYIGSAGGCIKPSSGYAFLIIQRDCNNIVHTLQHKKSRPPIYKKRHRFYDAIILTIAKYSPQQYPSYILALFTKNTVDSLANLMTESMTLAHEIRLFYSFPKIPFFKSFIQRYILGKR